MSKVAIKYLCGKEVDLEVIGGQYQNEYQNDCECGRKWLLKELSEAITEMSDEE